VLLAALFAAVFLGYVQATVFLPVSFLFVIGLLWLYWGVYYIKNCESFDIVLKINFFIRKKDLEYYDTRRMVKDMGKAMIILGIIAFAGGLISLLVGRIESIAVHDGETMSYLNGILGIQIVIFIAIMVVTLGFLIVCRRSKYLKDPSMTPPREKMIIGNVLVCLVVLSALIVIMFIAVFCGYTDFFAVNPIVYGLILIMNGIIWIKNSETLGDDRIRNAFLKKRNLEYYDARRIIKDRGKMMVALGAVLSAGGLIYLLTGKMESYSYSLEEYDIFISHSFFDGELRILGFTFLVMLGMIVAFCITCRRSRYLKDPSVTPPKKGRI
jgi:hypothetical protein